MSNQQLSANPHYDHQPVTCHCLDDLRRQCAESAGRDGTPGPRVTELAAEGRQANDPS